MSTQTEILRLETARNTLRTKAVELGIAESTAKLDALATAYNNIAYRGTVNPTVKEGESYTIQPGYYSGGTVAGVAGGGNYSLQEKKVTPTKAQQTVAADEGYYGLAEVVVAAIPQNFQDVSSVTATAAQVLANAVFVTADGTVTAGTMPNNGAVNKVLSVGTESFTIPMGYHNGNGVVSIVTETKTATPSETEQVINATAGKVLSAVTVAPIPPAYKNATNTTAVAGDILKDKTAIIAGTDEEGNPIAQEVAGTMPNNGAVAATLSTAVEKYIIPEGYHNGSGEVSISTEVKTATPTKSEQIISPSTGKVLSAVNVAPIPDAYQNVTNVTATAGDVIAGKVFVDSTGAEVEGTMINNGAINETMDGLSVTSVAIPAGYTSGGTVSLTDAIEQALAAI